MTTALSEELGTILIVDDELANLRLLSLILTAKGYKVRAVKTGREAIASVKSEPPDLVLLDIKLPDIPGYEVCEILKSNEKTWAIPIIFLSALHETSEKLHAFSAGAVDYITKPFIHEEVLVRVQTHLALSLLCSQLENQAQTLQLKNVQLQIESNQRQQNEAALKISEKRFRLLFERNSAVMLIVDPCTGDIIEANRAAAVFYGWSIEQLKQMCVQEINQMPQADLAAVFEKIRSTDCSHYEFQHGRADGTIRDVEVFMSKIESAGKDQIYSIIHDITESKKDKAALREIEANKREQEAKRQVEARYAATFSVLEDGLWDWHIQSGEIVCSDICYKMLGYDTNEFPVNYTSWRKIVHPDDIESVENELNRSLLSRQSFSIDLRMKMKSEGWKWVATRGKAIESDSQHNPLRMVGTLSDITKRKKVEDENAKLEEKNRLLQKAESLGMMAGAIAHHFNNQLVAVIGNLEMSLDDLQSGLVPVKYLNDAMRAANKAAEISNQMLTYLGQTTGKRANLDLSETSRQSLPMLQAIAPNDLILNVALQTPGPIINANANQVQQLLINLVTNAWEAQGKNESTIELTVKTIPSVDIIMENCRPVDWKPKNLTYACLEVTDTGCGIAKNDIDKLFDPFFSSKFTGRGLGLPAVLGIVKVHGGAITVESKKGLGSTFRIFFPTLAEEVYEHPPKGTPSLIEEKGGTVLLVEDEEMMRNMAEVMLNRLGFKVLIAKDGIEAVEIFRNHLDEISVVLSDLTMPRMDGWGTLSALRRLRPGIPVVLASGHDESKVIDETRVELPQVFLHKPYQKSALKDALVKALNG